MVYIMSMNKRTPAGRRIAVTVLPGGERNRVAPSLAHVERLATELGASIHKDDSDTTWDVWTPAGFIWKTSGDHVITITYAANGFTRASRESWKREAAANALPRMQPGIERCFREDCDVCADQ